ncbi:Integrator complex subunit 8, partial [Stegodyphus mimosarum]
MFDSRTKHRPPSPQKILWFEFLLNPLLLEKHLTEGGTDPSPTDLIIKFLANSISQPNVDSAGNANNNQ